MGGRRAGQIDGRRAGKGNRMNISVRERTYMYRIRTCTYIRGDLKKLNCTLRNGIRVS